ncbi:MAG: hypothetical protein SOV63_05370 [Pyramidobacter porci]|uniref:hypothetical protein n=1 Tax=Pyramidobacter porci TaxID=2605789 RepID=UPI002A766270|nr:hypothetical protein [Pyramidobacter porci]MCI6261071.1 hypothetical protein [Pyramidobacter sp.]MDY2648217.1 hypothetical protein [Pyramidobacter porci]
MEVKKLITAIWLIWFCVPAWARPEEIFRLEIPAEEGGMARAVRPDGQVKVLGKVLRVPTATRYPGYTASAWAEPGTVAATAVNAIHVTVSVEDEKGRIVSLVPAETIAPAAGTAAAFVIDCPAGTGLFGGWAPVVGDRARVRRADGTLRELTAAQLPEPGETLVVSVTEDPDGPYMIDFENRVGGEVRAYWRGGSKAIATVERPFRGVGRFSGSKFQRRSALRANHCGVICVSTSDVGDIGGFQIIPWEHSFSPEMKSAWEKTQWMIVRSIDGEKMTARAPLFKGVFTPGAQALEKLWDFWSTYGRRSLVMCRVDGGEWRRFDATAGKDDHAFDHITHLRVYAPFTREPGKKTRLGDFR